MKTTTKIMIAAATLAITAGIAPAQPMKAEIPFTFRAGRTVLPAGTYSVDMKCSQHLLYIWNHQGGPTIILLAGAGQNATKEWKAVGDPVLAFECGAGHCVLTQAWAGPDNFAFSLARPAAGGTVQSALTLIRLVRTAGN